MREGSGPLDEDTCVACGSHKLVAYSHFPSFRRVSSDCRPYGAGGKLARCGDCGGVQKPNDLAWREDCAVIYNQYGLYGKAETVDQAIFDASAGHMAERCQVILRAAREEIAGQIGRGVIDYGCGKGAMVRAFAREYPGAAIDGLDTTRQNQTILSQMTGFGEFFIAGHKIVDRSWGLVTMIHCLEHIPNPLDALTEIAAAMKENGRLLIQVPRADENPFDILVADHRTHFSEMTLTHLLRRAGFEVVFLSTDIVPSEITLIAKFTNTAAESVSGGVEKDFVPKHLEWLSTMIAMIKNDSERSLGVLGSSIAANWLVPHAPDQFSHILDEDPDKHGELMHGCRIIAPNEAPRDLSVCLPFAPRIARRIAERLSELPLNFIYPGDGVW